MDNFFDFLNYIQRAAHFSILIRHPNFSVIYYILKWIFEIWAEKGYFLHKLFDKSREKDKWDIEKNGIAYSTASNLKIAYL